MSSMPAGRCPACAAEHAADQDFCACGEYLRWERTGVSAAVPASQPPPMARTLVRGAVPAQPAAPEPNEPATIVLRLPEGDPAKGQTLHHAVEPGQRERVLALVRNQSGIVDNYDLRIEGLPQDWWSIHPGTVYLVPFGSGGTYEQEVEVHLHPPRGPEAEARVWDLKVVADSKANRTVAAEAPLALQIQPYVETATTLRPQRKKGRRKATYDVTITNKANAPVLVALEGEDPDGELRFGFNRPPQEIPAGTALAAKMQVRPPKQIWIGRSAERRLEVKTVTGEEAAEPLGRRVDQPGLNIGPGGSSRPSGTLLPTQGTFTQKPWLPWWLTPVILLLALLLFLLFRSLPQEVVVPEVTGQASTFEAEKALTEAELGLNPNVKTRVTDAVEAGTVVDQTPAGGTRTQAGQSVSLLIAVGSGQVEVPSVVELTAAEADAELRAAELTLGQAAPQPLDPDGRIESQIPAPGEVVKAGTPVAVFYAPAGSPSEPEGSGASSVRVPAVAGKGLQGYAARLAELGLVPDLQRAFDAAPRDRVLGVRPAPGTPVDAGARVSVRVSGGFPEIAFSDGEDVRLVDGATGRRLPPVAATAAVEEDPAWAPDGRRIAFVADGEILVADLARPARRPVRVAGAPGEYKDLAWSARGDVLAAARHLDGTVDLCLIRISAQGREPRCKSEPSLDIALAIRWAPDGRSLFAIGRRPPATTSAIVRWTTDAGFTADPQRWSSGEFLTDPERLGFDISDFALSPDGTRVAAAVDQGAGEYRLLVADADDLTLEGAKLTPTRACKLTWREDSRELLITQADRRCLEGQGALLRVTPNGEPVGAPLATRANDPTYRPRP